MNSLLTFQYKIKGPLTLLMNDVKVIFYLFRMSLIKVILADKNQAKLLKFSCLM